MLHKSEIQVHGMSHGIPNFSVTGYERMAAYHQMFANMSIYNSL